MDCGSGSTLTGPVDLSLTQCQAECESTTGCVGFSYRHSSRQCTLRDSASPCAPSLNSQFYSKALSGTPSHLLEDGLTGAIRFGDELQLRNNQDPAQLLVADATTATVGLLPDQDKRPAVWSVTDPRDPEASYGCPVYYGDMVKLMHGENPTPPVLLQGHDQLSILMNPDNTHPHWTSGSTAVEYGAAVFLCKDDQCLSATTTSIQMEPQGALCAGGNTDCFRWSVLRSSDPIGVARAMLPPLPQDTMSTECNRVESPGFEREPALRAVSYMMPNLTLRESWAAHRGSVHEPGAWGSTAYHFKLRSYQLELLPEGLGVELAHSATQDGRYTFQVSAKTTKELDGIKMRLFTGEANPNL